LRILCVGNMLQHICLNITYRPILSTKAPLYNTHNPSFLSTRCKIWTKSYITCSHLCFDFFKVLQKNFWNIIHFHFFVVVTLWSIFQKKLNKSNCYVSMVNFQIYRSTILSSVVRTLLVFGSSKNNLKQVWFQIVFGSTYLNA
jgi:hypothetical protein